MNRSLLIGLSCDVEPETSLGCYIRDARIAEVLPDGNIMVVGPDGRLSTHKSVYVTITQMGLMAERLDYGRHV